MLDRETTAPGLRLELFVSDCSRSAAFYINALGFEVIRHDESGYVSLRRGGAVIGLNAVERLAADHPLRPAPGDRIGLGVEIVLMVDDVATAHAGAASISSPSPITLQPWGLTDFRVRDPDGYYIRVTGLSAHEVEPDLLP